MELMEEHKMENKKTGRISAIDWIKVIACVGVSWCGNPYSKMLRFRGRMRDSIRLRSRHRRAGDEQLSTGQLHSDGFESLQYEKIRIPEWVAVLWRG